MSTNKEECDAATELSTKIRDVFCECSPQSARVFLLALTSLIEYTAELVEEAGGVSREEVLDEAIAAIVGLKTDYIPYTKKKTTQQ